MKVTIINEEKETIKNKPTKDNRLEEKLDYSKLVFPVCDDEDNFDNDYWMDLYKRGL